MSYSAGDHIDLNNNVQNELACEVIYALLSIEGMEEAIVMAFYEEYKDASLGWLKMNGISDVDNIPYWYAWEKVVERIGKANEDRDGH